LINKQLLENSNEVSSLLEDLAYLPLAITQASAYINRNRIPIAKYLELLRNTEDDDIWILSREFRDDTRYPDSKNPVATTWLVSFGRIKIDDPLAADILSFMSCIEPKAIPEFLLPDGETKESKIHALGTLSAYSFITERDSNNVYDIHRLVQLAMRNWIRKRGHTLTLMKQAIKQLDKVCPIPDYKNGDLRSQLLPHAQKILRNHDGTELEERWSLCQKVGRSLYLEGRYRDAVQRFVERDDWIRELMAEDHPDRLASQHELAGAYRANEQIKEAVELLKYVVDIESNSVAEDHPHRLASQHELAGAYEANGQIKEAVELLEHVVDIRRNSVAEDHPSRLASQHELAGAYRANGQIKEAVELLKYVVDIQSNSLAEDHPNRLASQHELAGAYRANGQIKEAVELLKYVVDIESNSVAEDHPHRLASQHELAGAYRANGQIKEAVELLEHVVDIRRNSVAEDHPSRLASQHELAGAYEANGQIKEAVELLEHVVDIESNSLAEDHPSRLASQHALAGAYEAIRQIKEAVELLEDRNGRKNDAERPQS
jgi:tetratricopeptide (TPR) repeat protein